MTSGYVPTPDGRLYYEEAGDGTAVVLLHVGIGDSDSWDGQFSVFAEKYRTVRYDAMNYARSDIAPGDFWNHEHLRAVMNHLGIDRAALVGVSMGGGTAIDFALTYPGRVWALVPVAPGVSGYDYASDAALTSAREEISAIEDSDREQAIELSLRLWVDGPQRMPGQLDPQVRKRARQMLSTLWDKGDTPGEELSLDPPALTRLGEIRVPTLVIYGSGDVRALVGASQAVAHGIPGAETAVMAGLGHVPNMERPDEFNSVVLDFLAKHA